MSAGDITGVDNWGGTDVKKTWNYGLCYVKDVKLYFVSQRSVTAEKDTVKPVILANKLITSYLEELPWVMLSWVTHTSINACMISPLLLLSLCLALTHSHRHPRPHTCTPSPQSPVQWCHSLMCPLSIKGVWDHRDMTSLFSGHLVRNNKIKILSFF